MPERSPAPGQSTDPEPAHLVHPRRVWAGLALALVGAAALGLGIAASDVVVGAVGCVLLAVGAAVGIWGGILYDTHGARPVTAELGELRRGEVHPGTAPGDMADSPEARRDSAATEGTRRAVIPAAGRPGRRSYAKAGGFGLLIAAALILCAQGFFAHTATGQQNAVRDLGIAIVCGAVALRVLTSAGRHRVASILGVLCGVALVVLAFVSDHDGPAVPALEAITGAWVVVSALATLDVHRVR